MPQITLSAKYSRNIYNPFSSQDLKDKFLTGISTDINGQKISDETIDFYISSAIEQLESYLGLKLSRQIFFETRDYYIDDWANWGFIKATYPVQAAISLDGYLGQSKQISYPKEWLSVRKTSDNKTFTREFRITPNTSNVTFQNSTSILVMGSAYPILNWWRTNRNVPNYWMLKYITGFPDDKIPSDLLQAVGMIATIPILGLASDLNMSKGSLGLGVSSKSISLDGLSQSVSTYSNGQTGIYGARMKQYSDALFGVSGKQGLLETLKDAYSSIVWAVC